MKNVNLIYRLDTSEEINTNGLSLEVVIPVLMSLGELIKESNKIIYPNGREIGVNIKPFKQGSFLLDIVIFAHSRLDQLVNLVKQDNVKQIKELLEWLGIIECGIGLPAISLLSLVRFLQGKPKSIDPISPNEIRYNGENGASLTVPAQVHQLFQNCTIQNVVYNALGKPLEEAGISKIETYLSAQQNSKIEFDKKDAEYFRNYANADLPTLDSEEILENEMEVVLVPKRGSFDGDPKQWSFYLNETVITATIRDEDFLEKCKSGEIRLSHADALYVRLVQKIKKINGKVDKRAALFEVAEVLRYEVGGVSVQVDMVSS